jgi:hypothetical protein
MIKRSTFYYLCCQFSGWGIVLLLMPGSFEKMLITVGAGIFATHLLRTFLVRSQWLSGSVKKIWPKLLIAMISTCILAGIVKATFFYFLLEYHGLLTSSRVFLFIEDYSFFIFPWSIIYWLFNRASTYRRQELEIKRLEWRLKQMSAKAAAATTDPQAITDAISRITALIDQDPEHARAEINSFSRLLREGYLNN